MMKLYIAGGLFNEAEVKQRIMEGQVLRERFPSLDIFNPIEQPFNEDKSSLPTPISIFEGDTEAVIASDIFLADITNNDPGVMVELGIAISHKKIIICVNSDIRLKDSARYSIPSYSINHYVLGGIEKYGILVSSFDDAVKEIAKHIL